MADAKPHVEIREYESAFKLLEDLKREGITGDEKKKIFDRFIRIQARMRGVPMNVSFELTPLCNFDCKMCYVHLTKSQMEKEGNVLSTDQWLDIMRHAVDAGMMNADLTGGECLTHPGFKELYLYLRSQGVNVGVLTNGQLIDEEMADFFAQTPPTLIQITVYGSNEDAYENVTGRRAFSEVCAAIERLKKRGLKTVLTHTPSRYTQKDIYDLIEFLRSTGLEYHLGNMSFAARENTGREFDAFAPNESLYVDFKKAEQDFNRVNGAEEIQIKRINRVPKGYKPFAGIPCSSGRDTCHINWKGEMQPCIPFHTITRSIKEHGFEGAWNWIMNTMTSYQPPHECLECRMKEKCSACAAEKTLGVLNGSLNRAVCQRYTRYLDAGIISLTNEDQCV